MSRIASRAGGILAGLGVFTLMVELGLYWLSPLLLGAPHTITAPPVLLGCMLGFVGFYLLDNRGALEGGRFIVQSATGILAVVRGGAKRPGDLVVGPASPPPPGDDVLPPSPTPPPDADPGDKP